MGAFSGVWRAQNGEMTTAPYDNASVWGYGTAAAERSRNSGVGRGLTPGNDGPLVDDSLTTQYTSETFGYSDEDMLYGYGTEDGTADRPSWGQSDTPGGTQNAPSRGWPQWGPRKNGMPAGSYVRSLDHGSELSSAAKLTPSEGPAAGSLNKAYGTVEDAETSDPSQYEMQTSMTQRDKVRAGSQTQRASEYSAPIKSRIPGQRARYWPGGDRHYDMQPKAQETMQRPFWMRQGATGNPQWMLTNELYVSEPLTRQAIDNPYQGPTAGTDTNQSTGFTDEDMGTW